MPKRRWEAAVSQQEPHEAEGSHELDGSQEFDESSAAVEPTVQSGQSEDAIREAPTTPAPPAQRRTHGLIGGLIGALGVTLFSLVFVVSFIGALHNPGPRSVPVGVVGPPSQASALGQALDRADPGAFVITAYPNTASARDAIFNRTINAALTPGSPPQLLVATATGQAVTNATAKIFTAAANSAGVDLATVNIRPLHESDPEGLSQVFFVIALLTPSLVFGNMLVKQFSRDLEPLLQLAVIAVYAVIVAAVATAIADAGIGALTGAPWGLFGIGALLAFAAAVVGAASTRWTRGMLYIVIVLLFIPIGISSSGTTLGPNMITQWYADLGKALPPGTALPAVQNTIYFDGNAITRPLLVLSAWALVGAVALALAGKFHPPMPGEPTSAKLPRPW
jgi:hypothetical protein